MEYTSNRSYTQIQDALANGADEPPELPANVIGLDLWRKAHPMIRQRQLNTFAELSVFPFFVYLAWLDLWLL